MTLSDTEIFFKVKCKAALFGRKHDSLLLHKANDQGKKNHPLNGAATEILGVHTPALFFQKDKSARFL